MRREALRGVSQGSLSSQCRWLLTMAHRQGPKQTTKPQRGEVMKMETLKTGSKAFFDSYSGLIPCVVLAVKSNPRDYGVMDSMVTFKLTAERHGYKKSETLTFH